MSALRVLRAIGGDIRLLWRLHGTKILGYAQGIVAGLVVIPDLIPPPHLKWWLAINVVLAVFTVKRGHTNSAAA